MKWFYNMKIRAKMLMGFVIIALLCATIGVVGIRSLTKLNNNEQELYKVDTMGIAYLANLDQAFMDIKTAIVSITAFADQDKTEYYDIIDHSFTKIENTLQAYEKTLLLAKEENNQEIEDLTSDLDEFKNEVKKIVEASTSGKSNSDVLKLIVDTKEVGDQTEALIDKMSEDKQTAAEKIAEHDKASAHNTINTLIAIVIVSLMVAILLGLFIANIISKSINKMVGAANSLSEGNLDIDLNISAKDETGNLAEAFGKVVVALRSMSSDVNMLSIAAIEGRLDTRADSSKLGGEYGRIVDGVNKTLDVLVGHIDSMPSPVMIIDKDFNINYMNKNGADLLALPQKQILGTKCYEHFKTSDCNTANCACATSIQQNRKVNRETDAHPRGMNLDISYTAIPLMDENKQVIGAMEMITDQTAIKNATRVAKKQAEYQNKEVSKLLENIENLAEGILQCNVVIEPTDQDTSALGEIFAKIYRQFKNSTDTMSSYITEMSNVLTEMSNGNIDIGITGDYKGDFIEIKNSVNLIIDSLNNVLSEINSAAQQVASGSNQMSDSSMALSQGATEQASSVEQLTASIEEVASQTRLNATNANQANELAENAMRHAEQGNVRMKEMLKAMDEINVSSANISKIIKVIDEIAFQTNILALNAAVEAARAGQHGKGFAVVAEEVRNLAARSANAAKETTVMIEGSIKKVEDGTKIANETAAALEQIVEGVAKSSELVGSIATASNEQSIGISQINQGIQQVSQVVQTNSATSQESAAASEELSSQAEMLKEMVAKFKLKKNVSGIRGLNDLNPEILKMLESMSEKKKVVGGREVREEVAASKIKIALSDMEFGKY